VSALHRHRHRVVVGLVAGLLGSVMLTSPAFADPPGPTDYQSEIVSVEPPTPTIETSIIGGDSFFELTVAPGTEAMVIGYQGEDMLWFRADGTVWENQNSPSTYLNADRLGGGGVPDTATADAVPDWTQVAADGNYSWHDHRAHWMQEARPFGSGPGDQILESVIPLVVDGTDVDVTVISTWQPAPSALPVVAGFVVGLGLAVAAWFLHRARRRVAALVVTMPVALLALTVGAWQFRSLPPETGPKLVWWVLPMVAVASAFFGALAARRSTTFAADAAMLLVGVELAIWGFVKRDGLSAAIIPTDAPGALDRFATAMALSSGVGFAGLALWWLFRVSESREPTGSPLPAHP
jgi:hypothetical protein